MGQTWKRLAGPTQLGSTTATQYTVPASTKTIVRKIELSNPEGGTDRNVKLSIGADAAGTRILDDTIVAGDPPTVIWGPIVLDAAEIIAGHAAAANEVVITIHGQELTL